MDTYACITNTVCYNNVQQAQQSGDLKILIVSLVMVGILLVLVFASWTLYRYRIALCAFAIELAISLFTPYKLIYLYNLMRGWPESGQRRL